MPSSDIESVRSGQLGLRTYEPMVDVAALNHNSRLRVDNTFQSSYSGSTQNLGYVGCFWDLSDFRVPSYGSVLDFRGESPVKSIGIALFCSVSIRNPESES